MENQYGFKVESGPFPDDYFTKMDSGLLRINTDVMIKEGNKIKHMELTADHKALYGYLMSFINVKKFIETGEYKINPGTGTIEKAMGWGNKKTLKIIDELKEMGLIKIKKTKGKPHNYTMVQFQYSKIILDRKHEDKDEYIHDEIKWYIEARKQEIKEIKKTLNIPALAILEEMGIDEDDLKEVEKRTLETIMADHEKIIIYDAISRLKEKTIKALHEHLTGQDRIKRKVPFYNWLESDGNTDDQGNDTH